ncbi:MAG: TolC family protein [Armatimonadetes bacterium]|nr:TolC family protein [Armatimonadota bacterium]
MLRGLGWAILLLLLAWTSPAPGQEAPVLTLEDALAAALQANRPLRESELEVHRHEDLLAAARARRFPALQIGARQQQLLRPIEFKVEGGALGTYPSIGAIPPVDTTVASIRGQSTYVTAGLSQPLTGLHKIGLAVEVQAAELKVAQQSARGRRQALAAQVRQAYYSVLEAQDAVQAAGDTLALYVELERVADQQLALQAVLKADLLEVRARRKAAEAEALVRANELATYKERLNLLLGRELSTDFRVAAQPVAEASFEDLPGLQARALANRPDVHQAALRLEQARVQREIQRAEYLPEVDLNLTYFRQVDSGLLPGETILAELAASWEPFDWGRRDREIAEKDHAVEQAESAFEEARQQIQAEVAERLRKVREARALEEAARAARDAAEERHRVAVKRFEQKSALLKDVLEAQAQLSAARRDFQRATVTTLAALAELARAVGED